MIYSKLNIKSHLKVIWNGIILLYLSSNNQMETETKTRCGWCYPATYTKNTDRNGEPRLWWCHFIWILILETFQAGLSWITILNKGEFQESIWQFRL
jgi:hypothetical protein